jgi:hypothetical protein
MGSTQRANSSGRKWNDEDKPENMPRVDEVGKRAAMKLVDDKHFPTAFDLK